MTLHRGSRELYDIASGHLIYFDYFVCVPLICMVIVIQVRYGLLAYHLLGTQVLELLAGRGLSRANSNQ